MCARQVINEVGKTLRILGEIPSRPVLFLFWKLVTPRRSWAEKHRIKVFLGANFDSGLFFEKTSTLLNSCGKI